MDSSKEAGYKADGKIVIPYCEGVPMHSGVRTYNAGLVLQSSH